MLRQRKKAEVFLLKIQMKAQLLSQIQQVLLRNVLLKGCKKGCPAGLDLSQFETKEDFYVKQPDPNKISP